MIIFSASANPINIYAADNASANIEQLDKLAYNGDDLGAVYSKDSTSFKVWAPTASKVSLNLYATGSDEEDGAEKIDTADMSYDSSNGVWSVVAQGDLAGTYYTYSVTVDGKENETADIYAKAAGVNGNRSMVVDLTKTNPDNWENDKYVLYDNQTDAIVWEVHIKDFSNQKESGISEENRGKYLAFTETGTKVICNGSNADEIPSGIDYLKALGVTHVQINPFYDYGSVDESKPLDDQFNWGYDPKNYNVPEGSYSSNPYDGNVRINECKQMIQALHNAGIGVIMDVVYNHTYTGEDSFFNLTVPNYYYRFDDNGNWSNGSGCSNDTASEHAMYRKFMVDSVKYWAEEYHVDGFRFDLMGLHDVTTMNEIRSELDKIDKRIIMYGEAWNLSTSCAEPLATQNNLKQLSDRIGAFNDGIRDGLKGNNFNAAEKGFIQGSSGKQKVINGIKGATDDWAKVPGQAVTYSSCHDNLTLYDKLVFSVNDSENQDFRKRYDNLVEMNKLSGAIVLTSQGIPFMLAGEEMARSKDGDENSYISSPKLNQIDWTSLETFGDLTAYYAGLIEIRKNFKPFTDSTTETAQSMQFFENTDKHVIAYSIDNKLTPDTQWSKVVCIFNSDEEEKEVTLECGDENSRWVIIADNTSAGLTSLGEISGNKVKLSQSSAIILVDKESFDKIKLTSENKKFKEILSKKQKNNFNATSSSSYNDKSRDTGNPVIPMIIGGAIAAGVAGGLIAYNILKKRKR